MGVSAFPQTYDPRRTTDAMGQRLSHLIFQSLVKLDSELKIVGDAAETWEQIDKNRFQFSIPKNIQFSNNRRVDKEDLLYSFNYHKSQQSPFYSTMKNIKSIKVSETESHWQLQLELKQVVAPFLQDLVTIKIIPAKEIKADEGGFLKKPFGSGPFDYKSVSPQSLVLSRKSKKPELFNSIQFKLIKDDNTRFQKILRGEIDIIQNDLPADKVHYLRQNHKEKFRVLTRTGPSMTYLLINHRDPLLKEKAVRKAIQHSLNLEEIIKYKHRSLSQKATSILNPGNPFFNDKLSPQVYSPEKARELLDRTGIKNLEVELKTSSNPSTVENAKVLSFLFKKAGIKVNLKSYEWGIYYEDIKKGRFQMALMKWIGAIDPDIYRLTLHSSETPPGRNRGHFNNKRFDELTELGLKTIPFNERKQIYNEVQQIAYDELATIPLWYDKQVFIINDKIAEFDPPLSGDYSGIAKASIKSLRKTN